MAFKQKQREEQQKLKELAAKAGQRGPLSMPKYIYIYIYIYIHHIEINSNVHSSLVVVSRNRAKSKLIIGHD